MIPMSNKSEEGIAQVKQFACDKLLQQRTETKLNTLKTDDILNRVHVAMPVPRDDKERPIFTPEVGTEEERLEKTKKKKRRNGNIKKSCTKI